MGVIFSRQHRNVCKGLVGGEDSTLLADKIMGLKAFGRSVEARWYLRRAVKFRNKRRDPISFVLNFGLFYE